MSFYPAHHITMGEGGAVATNDEEIARLVASFRDWGRDCYCVGGENNTCGKRFSWQMGKLPFGYDHKYIYSHIGYNLKVTDMQSAVGCAQLQKLESFVAARIANYNKLMKLLAPYEDRLILPRGTEFSEPAWFAFPITIKTDAGFSRSDLTAHLENLKIETRSLFSGNLLRHPVHLTAWHPKQRGGVQGYRGDCAGWHDCQRRTARRLCRPWSDRLSYGRLLLWGPGHDGA